MSLLTPTKLKSWIVILATIFAATGAAKAADMPDPDNRVVYELFVRNFSAQANFKGVEAQVDRLKNLGIDVIWLMPIYTPGETDRWGTYASPYCIKDFKGIDPMYGTADDLHSLVNAIHNAGMEVWLDWVANHTSTDHPWLKSNLDYYELVNGVPQKGYGGQWTDVYELNYNNPDLRKAMIDAMKYWVTEFDIDGFRCDHVEGVPHDFWKEAITEINAVKRIGWLAEVNQNIQYIRDGFDYDYAWGFNTRLRNIGTGSDAKALRSALSSLISYGSQVYVDGRGSMVYLSNHDLVQENGTEEKAWGNNLKPMTVVMFTAWGMPMIYNGQEISYKSGKVSLAQKSTIKWTGGDASMTQLITSLIDIKHRSKALKSGSTGGKLVLHTASDDKVCAYERRAADESVVVLLNLGDSESTFSVTSDIQNADYVDAITGAATNFAKGVDVTLPAHGYAIYIAGIAPPASYAIYLDDQTGWADNTRIYAWNEDGQPELFGGWPGASPSSTTVVDGVKYKVFPFVGRGESYHLIFSNNGDSKTQFDGPVITLNGNYFITATSTSANVTRFDSVDIVDTPEADQPVEYFNLQGIRVDNPANGQLLIRRQGASVKKILVK